MHWSVFPHPAHICKTCFVCLIYWKKSVAVKLQFYFFSSSLFCFLIDVNFAKSWWVFPILHIMYVEWCLMTGQLSHENPVTHLYLLFAVVAICPNNTEVHIYKLSEDKWEKVHVLLKVISISTCYSYFLLFDLCLFRIANMFM